MRNDRQAGPHVLSSYVVMRCGAASEESHVVFFDALSADSNLAQAEDPQCYRVRVRA